jgi:excisionase family DNA binding protein
MSDTKTGRLLTREEMAERLHVSLSTLDRLVAAGELVARKIGRQVRFSEADYDTYLDKAAA